MNAFRRDERAQSLVEFSLMLPVILMIVTGIFDLGRAVWQENTLAYAAREGTRYAIVHGSGAPGAPGEPILGPCTRCDIPEITAVVQKSAVGVASITVVTDYPALTNDRDNPVVVDASAPFVPLPSQYLLGSAFSITLRGGSQLYIQR